VSSWEQGRNEGGKGTLFPERRIAMGAPNDGGSAEKSQQCHKHFLQYSTFTCERPQVLLWGRQTSFLPRAPSYLVRPLAGNHVCWNFCYF